MDKYKTTRLSIVLAILLASTGCFSPSGGVQEKLIEGVSLEDAGYSIHIPEDLVISDPDIVTPKILGILFGNVEAGMEVADQPLKEYCAIINSSPDYYADLIPEITCRYTAVMLLIPFVNGADQLPASCLIAFPTNETEKDNAVLKVSDTISFTPQEGKKYLVYRDADICVYDVLPMVQSQPFEKRLRDYVDRVNQVLEENPDRVDKETVMNFSDYALYLEIDKQLSQLLTSAIEKEPIS